MKRQVGYKNLSNRKDWNNIIKHETQLETPSLI